TTEGMLGKGGMGEVLLATDTRLNRKVAIKRILGSAARSKTAVSRFLTEAQSIAAVNHPNIVQIYEFGRAKDGPFLIMEFVEGSSLLDKCREGPIELEEAIDLTCQLCDGLSKAHAANIVHRDIKPANVLLTEDGVPKLTDFGLAKDEAADTGMTMAGAVIGTIDFMPPEQRKDAALTDNRSDLWSLAATLYQMVTGKSPKIIKFNDVPKTLQDVLGKALEDSKDDRYQAASELKEALQGALTGDADAYAELDQGECPHCGTKNDASRKFCRNPDCGGSLEVICMSCSESIPMWEAVCGSCGANQADLLETRREEMAQQKQEAEELFSGQDYSRAISLAGELGSESDLRLQHLKHWSAEFVEDVENERDRELHRLAELLGESLKHEEAHDFPAGIKTLQQVAEPIRKNRVPGQKETVAAVLTRLTKTQGEVQSLEEMIRGRISQRQINNLLPEVEKLLKLVPTREDILKLKEQLIARNAKLLKVREESYTAAMKAFNAQDYLTCLAELKKIDPSLEDDEIRELREAGESSNERVKDLDRQITTALSSKQFDGLLETVEEYLFLQQADTERQKLRDQLIERKQKQLTQVEALVNNATQLQKAGKYEAALSKLQQIPEFLRSDQVKSLEGLCTELDYARQQAVAALRRAKQSGQYGKELSTASIYHAMLDRNPGGDDAEFKQLYVDAQQALKQQKQQAIAADKLQKNMKVAGIAGAVAVAALVLLGIGLWANSARKASNLASAMQRQRWDEVLSVDPDNVTALIGRANQRLRRSNPDLESILLDVERTESLNPGLQGTNEIKGNVYALQSVQASESGDVSTGETKLREAERLKVNSAYADRASRALAHAYVERAESSVTSGNLPPAIADAKRAMALDNNVVMPASIALAMAESKAADLVDAYERSPKNTSLIAAADALNTASGLATKPNKASLLSLRNRIAAVLLQSITAFESTRSTTDLQAALASAKQLERELKDQTLASGAKSRIATALVTRFSEISLDQSLGEISLLDSLNADSATRQAANRLIGPSLVRRFRDYLGKGDYKTAMDDYSAIASLDTNAAKQVSGDWLKIPEQDYDQIPTSVFANFPSSALAKIPASVIAKLPARTNSIGIKLKLIPAGNFLMGSESGGSDEKPSHQVTLTKPYELGVYEVTQDQYEDVMGTNPSKYKGWANPVEHVSWEDAVEFCKKLSSLPGERSAGRVYRLPTEAEWEYACRAGTFSQYSFGNEAGSLGDYAWYKSNSGSQTHPVGEKRANLWGLYDMHGNVGEWCSDWYGVYPSSAVTDPAGASSSSARMNRGGSCRFTAEECRSAFREPNSPSVRFPFYGFRVACVPSGQ
ncbi:SUMF1/EgtB/PvdO family nonheme iron enzyme, partial [bacterium]|nr:SUMF1/EgtB/PvdO family nonheme iron enzyme [bacterium]